MPITTIESLSGEVYSIQHCVIKFLNDLWQAGGFFRVLRFPPPIKLTVKAWPIDPFDFKSFKQEASNTKLCLSGNYVKFRFYQVFNESH